MWQGIPSNCRNVSGVISGAEAIRSTWKMLYRNCQIYITAHEHVAKTIPSGRTVDESLGRVMELYGRRADRKDRNGTIGSVPPVPHICSALYLMTQQKLGAGMTPPADNAATAAELVTNSPLSRSVSVRSGIHVDDGGCIDADRFRDDDMEGDDTWTVESTRPIGVKRAKRINRNKVLDRVVDSIAGLQDEMYDVTSVITQFLQRQDRDVNIDEEVALIQYLPTGSDAHRKLVVGMARRVDRRKRSAGNAGNFEASKSSGRRRQSAPDASFVEDVTHSNVTGDEDEMVPTADKNEIVTVQDTRHIVDYHDSR